MRDPRFQHLVQEALALIPAEFQPHLENVELIVEEEPDKATRRRLGMRRDETLYGLYEGTPLTERLQGQPLLPDRIRIFRRPLVEDFPDPDALKREVALTVLHEIAHHFGIDEDRLEELGFD